jgi:hypothetical protein
MPAYEFKHPSLPVEPLMYGWSFFDKLYYGQIISDEEINVLVEQKLNSHGDIICLLDKFKQKNDLNKLFGVKLVESVCRKEDLYLYHNTFARLIKTIIYDGLYCIFHNEYDELGKQPVYYKEFYKPVEGYLEKNIKNTILYFIEKYPQYGKRDEDGNIAVNLDTDIVVYIKLFMKSLASNYLNKLIGRELKGEFSISADSIVVGVVDVELMIIESNIDTDDQDDDEIKEVVAVRAEKTLNLLGVNTAYIDVKKFVTRLIDISFGVKKCNLSMAKDLIEGNGGKVGTTFGKKIHKSSLKEKLSLRSEVGRQYIQKKSEQGLLRTAKKVSEEKVNGGDIYIMVDCTGSTIQYMKNDDVSITNLLETLCVGIADAAMIAKRKLSIYFYNEKVTKIVRFLPTDNAKTTKFKKLEIYDNHQFCENDELSSFEEVFKDMNYKPSVKHSLIFLTDGGVLTSNKNYKEAINKTRLLFNLYTNIQIIPVLFSSITDTNFTALFDGIEYIQISKGADFDVEVIADLIKNVVV